MEQKLDVRPASRPRLAPPSGLSSSRILAARQRLSRFIWAFGPEARAARAEINERAELGYAVLSGEVDLKELKGPKAEPYLQGVDVIELRGQRLFSVLDVRMQQAKTSLWRLSPAERVKRKMPATPVGRRHQAWLDLLVQAGMIKR